MKQNKVPSTIVIASRIPYKFYEYLRYLARKRGVTMNDYIKNALEKYTDYKQDEVK